ncbi:MAG: glucosyl transferase [Ignavibacteriaceae bacterium]
MLFNNCYKKVLTGFLLFISLFITSISCDSTEPTPPDETKPTLTLALDDASCTEAWLQLQTKDLTLPAELTLKQYNQTGDSVTQTFSLSTPDSLLYIDSLLPNQNYKFKVLLNTANNPQPTTNQLSVTTMDTTSHNFTFQSWTFGTIGSSVLYDVAIINENNIWAVGDIKIADTSQNGYTTYNAVHWDGSDWELFRIPNYDYPNTLVYGALQTIFAFSANDIWFCSYSNLVHYDGSTFSSKAQFMTSINFNGQVLKMWGTDKNNIYCVGRNGAIYHYYGTNWQRIESGITLNINDIWGDYNDKTQDWEILTVASNFGTSLEKEILQIKNNSVTKLALSPQMWPLKTVWFISNKQYYVAGAGIYQKRLLSDSIWKNNILDFTTFTTTSLRGNDVNDLIAVGAFGDFLHFNGVSWKIDYQEPLLNNGSYTKVTIIGDLVVAVGGNNLSINSEAVILIGRR